MLSAKHNSDKITNGNNNYAAIKKTLSLRFVHHLAVGDPPVLQKVRSISAWPPTLPCQLSLKCLVLFLCLTPSTWVSPLCRAHACKKREPIFGDKRETCYELY